MDKLMKYLRILKWLSALGVGGGGGLEGGWIDYFVFIEFLVIEFSLMCKFIEKHHLSTFKAR
ncbi:hypothetical protein HYX00_04575 [Candidatus Woesearchaeota archaeon]|nr:hypothetical protein [Candidatus Woesearchaeota archaeon]